MTQYVLRIDAGCWLRENSCFTHPPSRRWELTTDINRATICPDRVFARWMRQEFGGECAVVPAVREGYFVQENTV